MVLAVFFAASPFGVRAFTAARLKRSFVRALREAARAVLGLSIYLTKGARNVDRLKKTSAPAGSPSCQRPPHLKLFCPRPPSPRPPSPPPGFSGTRPPRFHFHRWRRPNSGASRRPEVVSSPAPATRSHHHHHHHHPRRRCSRLRGDSNVAPWGPAAGGRGGAARAAREGRGARRHCPADGGEGGARPAVEPVPEGRADGVGLRARLPIRGFRRELKFWG